MSFKENYEKVLNNIDAAKKNRKEVEDVVIVAVTKTYEADVINDAIEQGICHVAENRVQELQRKYDEVNKEGIHWHLIGSLQTNKVKYIIDKVELIHSLDRYDLAKEIDKRAKGIDKIQDCLIQIKVSEEDSKQGLAPKDLIDFIKTCRDEFTNIHLRGIMGMAPYFDESEEARKYFKKLKIYFDKAKEEGLVGEDFNILSMGMSNDYQIAIEEGATMVRIGSALFAY